MQKKVLAFLVAVSLLPVSLFAAKKITSRSVGSENSWQEKFDINQETEHEAGKYNVLVTAEDKAGNKTIAGPFNIYIDPKSDLPVSGITNPVENMRVPGNLNIVGTCVDDDKVTEVWLILDGDEENPVKAQGTEFWSYFLDTTKLFEGPHTIEVYGIDNGNPDAYKDENGKIDTTRVIPKKGNRTKVTWQLDRRAPVIEVTNLTMGQLVSGRIDLSGTIKDGNGINTLEYSLDGGKYYSFASIKEEKYKERTEDGLISEFKFNISVNTKDFPDGVATCWFRARDNAGSVGNYAFLYFIDNTNPDIRIISPAKDEVKNGVFTIAGYAKDINGIQKLTWQWGQETGEFELTPGNPYWVKEVNSIGKQKSEVFTVTGTDTMGNTVVVKHTIALNQEDDKPVVTIGYPSNGVEFEGEEGALFLRGIVTDDDGPVSVTYKVDNGEEKTIDCIGVFYAPVEGTFADGNHTISVYGTDKYGVKGNVTTSTFKSKGVAPVFGQPVYKAGGSSVDFVNGLTVNPEADGTYEVPVSSTCGLSSAKYRLTWGKNGLIEGDAGLKGGEKNVAVSVPLSGDALPWGVAKIEVTATDIYGRPTVFNSIVNIRDLTKIWTDTPGVYFTDSKITEDGAVIALKDKPLTGYFAGGKISSVALSPAQRGVDVSFKGNVITLSSETDSTEFKVQVTDASGAVYTSRALKFVAPLEKLVLSLDDTEAYNADRGIPFEFETPDTKLSISGKVTVPSAKVRYRILSVKANMFNDVLLVGSERAEDTDWSTIDVSRRGTWSITNLNFNSFAEGVAVVEIVAETADGQDSAQAVFIRKIPYAPEEDVMDGKKKVVKAAPKMYWLSGRDNYGVCVYQGSLDNAFKYVRKENLRADEPAIVFTANTQDTPKPVKISSSPLNVQAESRIDVELSNIDNETYKSGMNVLLGRGAPKDESHAVSVTVKSNSVIKSVSYTIDGVDAPGGLSKQSGSAPLNLISSDPETFENVYSATIPLSNLPARITNIAVSAEARGKTVVAKGTFNVIRQHENIDNQPAIYWQCEGKTRYDDSLKAYVLNDGSALVGYCNVPGPVTARVRGETPGLKVSSEGNIIKLTATTDGTFRGVSVRVNGEDGGSYLAPDVNLVVDTAKPTVNMNSPKVMSFVKDSFIISGTASDGNGIAKIEYAITDEKQDIKEKDGTVRESGKAAWKNVAFTKAGEFWVNVSLKEIPDGYVPFSFRVTDTVGKTTYVNSVLHKDVTPPEVKVILPEEGSVVNGENTIVFSVKDAGRTNKIMYTSASGRTKLPYEIFVHASDVPVKKDKDADGNEVDSSERYDPLRTMNFQLPNMRVGTFDAPIDNNMSFTFTDDNGNETVINKWDFKVDEKSDKPVTEIHLPEEMQVVTTDFTISGVVYDDDGKCKIFYKIDNDEYKQYITEDGSEYSSSYKFDIPLLSLKDNEHVITAYAIDVNGVKGDEIKRTFRVSLEEPKGGMTSPEIEKTVKGTVTLKGWASDKNDIGLVQISVDNGATFNDAKGTTDWSYTFNTAVVQDGTHVVFIRIYDKYGIGALYSSLINIDNTAPNLRLELPLDDSKVSRRIFMSGQTTDNIELTSLFLTIRSLEGKTIPDRLAKRVLVPDEIITQVIDISELNNGFYNIELTGTDAAGNITRVSRNIEVDKTKPLSKVDVLYPLNGEHCHGQFNIYGSTYSEKDDPIDHVDLYIDRRKMEELGSAEVTKSGYFKFTLNHTITPKLIEEKDANGNVVAYPAGEEYELKDGVHSFQTIAVTKNGKRVLSNEQSFVYSATGPWVTLETFTYGDFARNRPLLEGNAGYILTEEEKLEMKDKTIPSDRRRELENRKVKRIYISFDNGKTYEPVAKEGKTHWEYRVENLDIPAGFHFMLVKAEMYNGDKAITRTVVQVDRTNPSVTLISPGESGRYNQQLLFSGLSGDDIDLNDVTLTLRKGDKASYEVPKFIQGLYFDASVWGATLWNVGVGLTAFDGAVKVQASFGQFTQEQRDSISKMFGKGLTGMRFGGNVFSGKIIAQLAYIPFRYFWGRDWDWLTATVSIGANFSYFTDSGASATTGEKVAQVLSAALMQFEFPRVTIEKAKYFRTWSTYVEPQVWFIPSDVGGDDAKKYVFTFSIGARTTLF
ncbi:Ig-like domain-containing protein [Treponema sp.]|uniref:Ig-like domain-containing protein n=1 Tax=Treponema sp. TaxID=166 RepID=UPI00388CED2A